MVTVTDLGPLEARIRFPHNALVQILADIATT